MSVAFRRESDDEHLEPKFELPIPPGPNLVTARGLALISAKIETLEAELGALGEQPVGREAAKTQEGVAAEALRRDLRYWRTRHATAELAPQPEEDEAGIGTAVTFRLGGAERRIEIVGHDEADPDAGRIAFTAPLARAMTGAAAGESVDFNGVEEAIHLVSVAPIGGE